MKKRYSWNYYLLISLQILIGMDLISRCINGGSNLLIYFGLFLIIVVNDQLRVNGFLKHRRYYLSIFISMAISIMLAYKVQGYIDIYVYIILFELIIFTEGTVSRLLIVVEVVLWIILLIFRFLYMEDIKNLNFWRRHLVDMLMITQTLFFYIVAMFTYRALRKEKRKVDELNKKLELSYDELRKESEKIEELTIEKERNRVAGEIHDNLGHSLIALNMNLDVAENIMDKDFDKSRKLINKSRKLAKESMEILREAVYALKESNPRILKDSIEDMIDNIESAEQINIILNMDEKLEELPSEYKDTIYSTIKESLTNSMKHGKANKISIEIKLDEDKVDLSIKDNGLGCSNLVKGNGLLGIEDRVTKLNGKVAYNSGANEGFVIGITLFIL